MGRVFPKCGFTANAYHRGAWMCARMGALIEGKFSSQVYAKTVKGTQNVPLSQLRKSYI